MTRARLLADDGRDLASVEMATSAWSRARGLLGRRGLAPGHALWLAPCRSIHTLGMRFPIDVVFLDRDLRVVKLFAGLPSRRLVWGGRHAYGALELGAGESARIGLGLGQRLTLRIGEAESTRDSAVASPDNEASGAEDIRSKIV